MRNTTDSLWTLKIEPAAAQHLGASTTFTGELDPGEVQVLYLYHGFEYHFRILDSRGWKEVALSLFEVDRDMGIAFAGDSLRADPKLLVELGEPTVTEADPRGADRTGLRERSLAPDTTRGTRAPADASQRRDYEERQERERRRGGEIP